MDPNLNDTSLAIYKQIEISLRSKIEAGHWPTGMMLPSRRELAKEYGVSPITIERAISPLISEGVLRADDRRGTFVAQAIVVSQTSHEIRPLFTIRQTEGDPARVERARSSPHPAIPTATIGIVASLYLFNHDHLELNNFWVRLIVQALEQAFSENGHRTLFFNRVQEPGQPVLSLGSTLRSALSEGVDALAVIGFGLAPQDVDESLAVLDGTGLPVVCITSGQLRRPIPHVFPDNHSAGYQAAQRLLGNACRDMLFLAPFMTSWVADRLEGVRAAIEHAGLPADRLRVYPQTSKPWVQEEDPQVLGYEAAAAYFAERPLASSVIGPNDGVCFGWMQAAAERGLEAGRDFTLVGFDDHPDARARHLTSMRPPMETMGQEASRLLLRALRGQQHGLQVRLPWQLIPRASCYAPQFASEESASAGKEAVERA